METMQENQFKRWADRWYRPLLVILILLAYLVRAYHLDFFSFWIDEALTPLRTGQSPLDIIAGHTFIQEAVSQDTHPPLYYLFVYITRVLWGTSDYAFRYFSLLWGVALVPLLFQFGRRLFGSSAGLIAALLLAVNPLQVWYGQEARMYTQVVFLGAASSLALWRCLELGLAQAAGRVPRTNRPIIRWFVLYIVLAGLALYTHYTAVFLIALQGLLWVWLLWRLGYRKLIAAGFAVALLAAIPLIPITIPRIFTGAETGYVYRTPLVMLNDVFGGFSMGLSAPETPWLQALLFWGFVLLWLLACYAITRYRHGPLKLVFLLIYLLAAVIGLAVLSLIKPSYQGVRHIMLGSPAFILMLAAGIDFLLRQRSERARLLGPAIGGLALLLAVGGMIGALTNLYFNPAVAKDDLRQVVAYIEQEAAPGDLVIYNDAIIMLAHWHYQERDDLTVTAMPIYPHAAREQTPQIMADLAADHERIWFVTPLPADGRDPERVVRRWLNDNLTKLDIHNFPARSTELRIDTFDTRPTAAMDGTNLDLSQPWQNLPALNAVDTAQAADNLWVDLLWSDFDPANLGDARLIFALRGPDGWHWVEQSRATTQPADEYSTADRSPATPHRQSYRLDLPSGLPPGSYELLLQGWDNTADEPTGDWQVLTGVEIQPTTSPNRPATGLTFSNGLQLISATPYDAAVKPGHPLPIVLEWAGITAPEGVVYDVQLVDEQQQVIDEFRSQPGANWLSEWPADSVVGEFLSLDIPADTEPGTYALRWQVSEDGQVMASQQPWLLPDREWGELGTVVVEPWPLTTDVPETAAKSSGRFGDYVNLPGYDLEQSAATLNLDLVWQTENPLDRNYFVFVHLVDPATGQPVAQQDWFPLNGLRPTTGWRSGEVLRDPYTLNLTDVPPGTYRLNVGFYHPDDFVRLPVTVDGELQPDNQLFLQEVSVE